MNNIEILEKLVERCKECKFACCEQCEINNTQVKAIENLLLELKGTKIDLKLQETENENLIKEYKELEEEDLKIRATFILSLKDYIPKSKVKEKIEELEKERKRKDEEDIINPFYDQIDITHIIEVLQELLEEGE